jgi:hypothetical protein
MDFHRLGLFSGIPDIQGTHNGAGAICVSDGKHLPVVNRFIGRDVKNRYAARDKEQQRKRQDKDSPDSETRVNPVDNCL